MSTATVGDLLTRAQWLTLSFQQEPGLVTHESWGAFDAATRRLLHLVVGPPRVATEGGIREYAELRELLEAYPSETRACRARCCADCAGHSPQLPDAASDLPLDRITVTLGALGDLLHSARQQDAASGARPTPLDDLLEASQLPSAVVQVLAIAAATAAVVEEQLPPGHSARPADIVGYVERGLDLLGDGPQDSALLQLASRSGRSTASGPNRQLEEALHRWAWAAREELRSTIASSDVLRNIANQGMHLYAVTDAIVQDVGPVRVPHAQVEMLRTQLRDTAAELQRLAALWRGVTTAARPSAEYVEATTDLHKILNEALPKPEAGQPPRPAATLAPLHALRELRHATADIADLLHQAEPLPTVLARSHVLYAPVRSLPRNVRRLRAHLLGNLAPMTADEARGLAEQASRAAESASTAHTTLRQLTAIEKAASNRTRGRGPQLPGALAPDGDPSQFPSLI